MDYAWLTEKGLFKKDGLSEEERARAVTLIVVYDSGSGSPFAHVVAHKASHRLHVALARALAAGTEGAARAEHYV